VTAGIVHKVFY